ncbi:MAG: PAS domain S-box protein [Dehalococcoidales bacterium]|nr:PAS domain S-box protein [Dehalococcoidales bacterium]
MKDPYLVFYQCAMSLSLVVSVLVAIIIGKRRKAPGAGAMISLAISTFVWTLGFLLETNSHTLEQQLFYNNIGYLGSMTVPIAWFFFALNYTSGKRLFTNWKRITPFCIIPLATVILVWTNNWHHLMWSNEHLATSGPFIVTAKTYGPFFWVALTCNYVLIITGAIFLLRRLFVGAPLYRGQAISLIIAVSLPLLWNIIYIFSLVPLPHKDLTPVTFAISGIAIVRGLMRFKLFRAIPFAREFIIEQMSDGILVFDMSNRLLEANPAAIEIFGVNRNIIGKRISLSLLSTALEGMPPAKPGRIELPLTVSGEKRIYEIETVVMHEKHKEPVGWLIILHNITERKNMQEQLLAQDRLASIGKLTSGVAHELNNPLTSIIGFSEFLLKRDLSHDIHADLNVINSEAERAAKIVEGLLTFARKHPEDKLPSNINVIIEKALEIRDYEQKNNNIEVITRFAQDLPEVMGNEFQLQQVFLNIIINAEFFMIEAHGKGVLTIVTEKAGDCVRVSFTDDGPGIPKENMKYLFSPFFTTKEVGKGTGLGLSICHGIITEHDGRIWAESESGTGACFIIELPVYNSNQKTNRLNRINDIS